MLFRKNRKKTNANILNLNTINDIKKELNIQPEINTTTINKIKQSKIGKLAFSLSETSIVICVMAIIIGITIKNLDFSTKKAYNDADKAKMKVIKQSLQTYFDVYGHLPAPADYTLANTHANYGKSKTTKNSYDGTLDADIFAYKWDKKLIPHIEEIEEVEIPSQQANTNLPPEYQEVEYIENTSTNDYIDTQYTPKIGDIIELKYQLPTLQSDWSCIGIYDHSSHHVSSTICISSSGSTIEYHMGGVSDRLNGQSMNDPLNIHNYKWDYAEAKLYMDNDLKYSTNVSNFISTTYSFYIFRASGDYKYPHKGRFYSLKVERNGNLIKNYVPAYRKSDGVIGIYETIECKFYTNQGTGTFLKGEDVKNSTAIQTQQTLTHTEEDCGHKQTNIKYNVYRGIVPFKELGFTEDDVIDSKGNFFEYYVPEVMTLQKNTKQSNVDVENFTTNGYVIKPTKGESEYIRYACPAKKSETPSGICEITNNNLYGMEFTESFEEQIKIAKPVYHTIQTDTQDQVRNIPQEYQEVEYIESTGTQYIATEFIPTTNTKLVLDFYAVNYDDNHLFGTTRQTAQNAFEHDTYMSTIWKNSLAIGVSNSYSTVQDLPSSTYPYNTGRHTLIFNDNGAYKLDNLWTFTYQNRSYGTYPLLLFARANGNSKGKLKLYSCKVYNDNTLKLNFVPCYRKSDGVIGLYDKVEGKFYTNAGTGTFLKGNDVNNNTSTQTQQTQQTTESANIPSIYQEVEYIESTGTQYIETNIIPTKLDKWEFKYQFCDIAPNSYMIFGTEITYQCGNGGCFRFGIDGSGKYFIDDYSTTTSDDNLVHTAIVDYNNKQVKIDNTNIGNTLATLTNYNMELFRTGGNYTNKYYTKMKIYYFKIYHGEDLIRDFVPCYRKSDGVIGLYDKVEGKFYTNQGSGTFLKGSNIDNTTTKTNINNLTYTTYELVDDVKQCVSRYIQPPYGLRVKNVKSNKDIEPNGNIAYLLVSHGEDGDKTCALKKPKVLGQSPIVVNILENADKITEKNKFEAQNCFNAVKKDDYNLVARSDFLTGTNTEYMFYSGKNNEDFDDIVEYGTLPELIRKGGFFGIF